MSPSQEREARRRRDSWSVISILTMIGLVLIAFYLIPRSSVGISFGLYGVVILLVIVTFVVPAILARVRQRRASKPSQSGMET